MFSWLSTFLPSSDIIYGPGRNAPDGGKNIRQVLDQRATQVMSVPPEVIIEIKSTLRKTIINSRPPLSTKPPIMKEFDDVFTLGHKNYFEKLRLSRMAKSEPVLTNLLELDHVTLDLPASNDSTTNSLITEE